MSAAAVLVNIAVVAVVAAVLARDWGKHRSMTWIVLGVLLTSTSGAIVGATVWQLR